MSVSQFAQYLKQVEKRDFIIKTALKVLLVAVLFQFVFMPLTGFLPRVEEGWTVDSTNPHICFQNGAKISAHRAGGDLAPEETMSAFKLCVEATEYEVDILEFDLHMTSDGELVLVHDSTLDRTSDAAEFFGEENVDVGTKTLSELKKLNMGEKFEKNNGERPYKGLRGNDVPENLRIVTLPEVFTYLEANGEYRYIIEIKNSGETGFKAADKLYATLNEFGCLDRAVVGTFHDEIEDELKSKYPDLYRGAPTGTAAKFVITQMLGVNLFDVSDFACLQIPTSYDLGIEVRLDKKSYIDRAHRRNIAVQYWTINDEETMRQLIEMGCDCIMTDNPALLKEVLDDYR